MIDADTHTPCPIRSISHAHQPMTHPPPQAPVRPTGGGVREEAGDGRGHRVEDLTHVCMRGRGVVKLSEPGGIPTTRMVKQSYTHQWTRSPAR